MLCDLTTPPGSIMVDTEELTEKKPPLTAATAPTSLEKVVVVLYVELQYGCRM